MQSAVSIPLPNIRFLQIEQSKFPNWLIYLFVATVFSKEIGSLTIAGIDYDMIGYSFCIIYFLRYLRGLYLNSSLNYFLFFLLCSSLIAKAYLNLSLSPLFKQWIPFALIFLVNYDFFARTANLKRIFKAYITVSYYTAIIGILQLGLKFFFGIKFLTGYATFFIDSVALEPSHYAALVLPACVYSFMRFKYDKWRSIIILLAAFGTFSSTTYVVMMLSLVFIYLNPLYLIFILPLLYYLYNFVFLDFEKFSVRVDAMSAYFEGTSMDKITNATSISFISNLEAAQYTVKNSPLIGSGLGGHEEMYQRYLQFSPFRYHYLYGINAPSAHSQLIRILSEWGIAGTAFYFFFLVKMLILKSDGYYRMVSIACLSHFMCKFLKLGGYFDYGTPFFAMLFFFNYMNYKKSNRK